MEIATLQTQVSKEESGWCASTEMDLGNGYVLSIKTWRLLTGRLLSCANLLRSNPATGIAGSVWHGKTGENFSLTFQWDCTRGTPKAVREQHRACLVCISQIRRAVPCLERNFAASVQQEARHV